MSLDHQIADAIAAASEQIAAQLKERLKGLGSEIGQAASAERVSIVREIRVAAEAELARKSQEAVASAQAEHARRLDEAVAAARAEGSRRVEEAMSAARAEQAKRVEEAVASARAGLQERINEAVAQAKDGWMREHEAAIEKARAHAVKEAEDELGRRHQAALATAVAAAAADAASEHKRRAEEALTDARAEAQRTLAEKTQQARLQHESHLAEEMARVRGELEAAHAGELDRARAEYEARLNEEIEQALADRDAQLAAAERSRVEVQASARQAELAHIERVADDIRRLDAARSLTDVLELLTESVAGSAPRAAMFIVRGGRVAGWRLAGFPEEADPRRLDFGVEDSGLVANAIRAGQRVTTTDSQPGSGSGVTPFGELPAHRAGLAVPIRVGGETVAVLYADDATADGHEVPSAWPEIAEILCRHAARCLEVLTVTRAVHPASPAQNAAPPPRYAPQSRPIGVSAADDDDAARRYAKLLVSEIKLYHEAAVSQGRRDRNLLERLRPEVDRARRLFEERIPAAVRARGDFFGQELVRTLANGDASLLGGR